MDVKSRVLGFFSDQDPTKTGFVPKEKVIQVLERCGLEHSECTELVFQFEENRMRAHQIAYQEFFDFVLSDGNKLNGHFEAQAPTTVTLQPSLGNAISVDVNSMPGFSFDKPKITAWNIKSPELSENIFEMYPGWAMLPAPEQVQLLSDFQAVCQEVIFSESSPKLVELLQDTIEKEFEVLCSEGGPETFPLEPGTDQEDGLKKFFEVRLTEKSSEEIDGFVSRWLKDPLFRWEYWKNQSVFEFCADDGSGGKTNDNAGFKGKAVKPVLDEVAWNLGLGVADFRYRYKGLRSRRTDWLLLKPGKCDVSLGPQPKDGKWKFDFFKLMVWDFALLAVRDRARRRWKDGEEAWDRIFEDIKGTMGVGLTPENTLKGIVEMIASFRSDILVLTEMSEAAIGRQGEETSLVERIKAAGGFRYRLFKSQSTDKVSNTIVLARKERFDHGTVEPFREKDGSESFKKIVVHLHSVDGWDYQVVAAHLSGAKHDLHPFFDGLEQQLQKKDLMTIVTGDLNFDLREKKIRQKVETDEQGNKRELVAHLLEHSKKLWDVPSELGTVSKKRTALQCQVSKIDMTDFSCKDFILLSEDLDPDQGEIKGFIARAQMLPDAECPSDHAAIHWQVPNKHFGRLSTLLNDGDTAALNDTPRELQREKTSDVGDPDVSPRNLMAKYCFEHSGHSKEYTVEDLADRLSTVFSDVSLPPAELAGVAKYIELRDMLKRCNDYFENSREVHQDSVMQIMNVVSGGKTHIKIKNFPSLHSAIKSLLPTDDVNITPRNSVRRFIDDDVGEIFRTIDLYEDGKLSPAEVLMWIKQISLFHPVWRKDIGNCLEDVLTRCRAKVEIEKYEKARDLMRTMAQYGRAYREVKKQSSGVIICSEQEGTGAPLQPEFIKTVEDLYNHGQEIFEEVEEFGEQLRTRLDAPFWSMGPLKDLERAKEKIDGDYKGEPRRLLDMVRFSLLCKDLHMAKEAIEVVREDKHWKIIRVKSTLEPKAKVGATSGYRDVKINAQHASGHLVEIQLHILVFYVIKQEFGHKIYEWSRKFAVAGVTSADDVLSELSPKLLKDMYLSAELELTHHLEKHNASPRRTEILPNRAIQKQMTVFECLRLSRHDRDKLIEHGHGLLDLVNKGLEDPLLEREILLMIGKAHNCTLPEGSEHVDLLKRACQCVTDKIDETDWSTADKLFLAICNAALGNAAWGKANDDAIECFSKALELFLNCGLESKHPQVAKTKKNLGAILLTVGQAQKGFEMLMSAEAAFTEIFGSRDHRTSQALLELGIGFGTESLKPGVASADEMWLKSIWYFSRCLTSRRFCFGEHDERVGNTYWEMAILKDRHGDEASALQDFNSCVFIWHQSGTLDKKKKQLGDEFKAFADKLNKTPLSVAPHKAH